MRRLLKACAAALLMLACASAVHASQFYIFPVRAIEGISKGHLNPLVNRQVLDLLDSPQSTAVSELVEQFQAAVQRNFPASTVWPSQVGYAQAGSYRPSPYTESCNNDFTAPVASSYAAVLGVSRASYYVVERDGIVELLIPVTLNLQIVKPDKAKVAYSLSDTLYSSFRFSRREMDRSETRATILRAVVQNMKSQVDLLVEAASKGFNPKDSIVRVVGRSGKYLVLDGGYELGFKKGDEPSAVLEGKPDQELFFKVIAAYSGHSIVRLHQGDVESGAALKFVFESAGDDSDKPALLPLIGFTEEWGAQNAAAELFAKSIGFSSRFQIVPVSTNFKETMMLATGQANCVDWSKFPGTAMAKGARGPLPHFIAKFDLAESKVYRNEGAGGTKSEEDFAVAASLRLLDAKSRVHYSEVVVEPYKLQRTNNQGLHLSNAMEIATKNSVARLAASFAKNAKLEMRELRVSRVDGGRMWISASGLEADNVGSYTVFRELDVKFNGRRVWLPLEVGDGADPRVVREGDELGIAFSRTSDDIPLPRKGDRVRFEGVSKPGAVSVQKCPDPDYVSERTAYRPPFAGMFIESSLNASPRLQVVETSEAFHSAAKTLLDAGLYKTDDFSRPTAPSVCYQPGYAVRLEGQNCEAGRCKATVLNGLVAKFRSGPGPTKDVQVVQRTELSGFAEPQAEQFLGLNTMLWFDGLHVELKKRLQPFSLN